MQQTVKEEISQNIANAYLLWWQALLKSELINSF